MVAVEKLKALVYQGHLLILAFIIRHRIVGAPGSTPVQPIFDSGGVEIEFSKVMSCAERKKIIKN